MMFFIHLKMTINCLHGDVRIFIFTERCPYAMFKVKIREKTQ
jgi:hypothetical protein